MSTRGGSILATQRDKIMEIIGALAAPVIITFLLYIVSSAAGAVTPAAVGYTVAGVGTSGTTGVSCIWVGSGTGACAGGLAVATFLVVVFNGLILLVVFLVVAVQGTRLAGAALEGRGE